MRRNIHFKDHKTPKINSSPHGIFIWLSNPIKNIGRVIQIEVAKKIAGKPKKMNMGGVVSGRGGSFEGTR